MAYKYIGDPDIISLCESAGKIPKLFWSCCECAWCPGKINEECPFWQGVPREGYEKYFERVINVGDQ